MHNSALFSFILSASTFLSYSALAACTANPDCATLGYTKTSCASGDLIMKCPFDTSKVQCIPKACVSQTCEAINKKTCGDICVKSGGCCSNADCTGGKRCTSDHECSTVCAVGDIYYSDKTCSADLVSGKTPIGVVGYVSDEGKHGKVLEKSFTYSSPQGRCTNAQEKFWTCQNQIDNMRHQCAASGFPSYGDPVYNGFKCSEWVKGTACLSLQKELSSIVNTDCDNKTINGVTGWKNLSDASLIAINRNTINNSLTKIPGASKFFPAGEEVYLWSSCFSGWSNLTQQIETFSQAYRMDPSYTWCYIEF